VRQLYLKGHEQVGYPFSTNIIGFERASLAVIDSSQPLLDSQYLYLYLLGLFSNRHIVPNIKDIMNSIGLLLIWCFICRFFYIAYWSKKKPSKWTNNPTFIPFH
jgi:hypothetical protein